VSTQYSSSAISALVYDGDREVHQLVHCLCRDLQIKSFHFLSGAEALGFYQQRPVEIVVAEINDQAVNGLTMAKRMRTSHPHTPIILLADPGKRERVNGMEKAANVSVVTKPIEPLLLARYLSEAVEWVHNGPKAAAGSSPAPLPDFDEVETETTDDIEDVRLELESAYALIDQLREQFDQKDQENAKLVQQAQRLQRMLQEREAEISRIQQVMNAMQGRIEQLEQQGPASAEVDAEAAEADNEALAERLAYIEESEERLMQRAQELYERETELAHREETFTALENGQRAPSAPEDDGLDSWGDIGLEDFDEAPRR